MSDDAQFDAFLKREGELARGLQGLAQSAPSAALDAAILASARAAMAQDARPVAANDGGGDAGVPRLAPALGWRWRMPAGIAAAVLVGVFAKQSFEASSELNQTAMPAPAAAEADTAPAPAPVMIIAESERAAADVPLPAQLQTPAAPARKAAPVRAKAVSPQQKPAPAVAPDPAAPAPAAQGEAASASVIADKASAQMIDDYARAQKRTAPALSYSAPPPLPMSAPSPIAAPMNEVVVSAKANRRSDASTSTGARYSASAMEKPHAPAPARLMAESAWLDRIEKLLEQGRKAEAVADWKAFREAYPAYPVPDATRAKLE